MEYFWKENKRFVMAVAGGALAFYLYYSFVIDPLNGVARSAEKKRQQEKQALEAKMAQGVPTEEILTLARRDRDANRKALTQLASEVVFKPAEKFKNPDREAKAHYDNQLLDLTNELSDKAVKGKVKFPATLGMGESWTDDLGVDLLQRLAVIERVVTLAIDSEAEKIEAIDGLYGLDLGPGVMPVDPKKAVFLNKSAVFMRFSGKEAAIFKVLHGAQKRGSYLAVTHFEVTRPDSTKNTFEAAIAVAMLKVDEKAPLEPKP